MSEYGNYDWNQNNDLLNEDSTGSMNSDLNGSGKKNKKRNKKQTSSWAKRVGAIVLSGVLFGGVAGGVFTGVTYATGATSSSTETTASSDSSSSTTTLQTTTASATSTSTSTGDGSTMTVAEVSESAMPAIVSITNVSVQEVENYFNMFQQGQTTEQEVESQGSGIIIGQNDTELLIATNAHVIEDADTLSVCFIDNEVYEAQVKGSDSTNDLAVIAVQLSDISEDTMSQIAIAELGDSDSLAVGEQVVAIGNALGYGQSTTTGIVSAMDRTVEGSESEFGFIQTDAAINPGNSGGALLNMQGQVIGINSAKLASTEVEGMGYAIPINEASEILQELMNRETRTQVSDDEASSIGISGQTVDSDISEAYGIPTGVYVAAVNEGSAAETAGITVGSVITAFDGQSVDSIDDLKELLTYYAAGETVDITISVANNGSYEEQTLSITLDKADTTTSSTESQQQTTEGEQNGQMQESQDNTLLPQMGQ